MWGQSSERLCHVSAWGEDHITNTFDRAELKNVLPRAEDNLGFSPKMALSSLFSIAGSNCAK